MSLSLFFRRALPANGETLFIINIKNSEKVKHKKQK